MVGVGVSVGGIGVSVGRGAAVTCVVPSMPHEFTVTRLLASMLTVYNVADAEPDLGSCGIDLRYGASAPDKLTQAVTLELQFPVVIAHPVALVPSCVSDIPEVRPGGRVPLSTIYVFMAVQIAWVSDALLASLAARNLLAGFNATNIATAKVAIITMTINNSISVKPDWMEKYFRFK